jgi:hypothetical protein
MEMRSAVRMNCPAILCLLLIASGNSSTAVEPATAPLTLDWADRYLTISGDPESGNAVPGDAIRIHYLEAYCRGGSTDRDWAETVIPHQTKVISAGTRDGDTKDGVIELVDRLSDGVIVRHRIAATHDEVRFTIVATNPTDQPSAVQWARPCVRVDGFVGADRDDVNPRPLSPIVPSSGLVGCYIADDSKILGIVWSPCQEVFQGVATCLHSDLRIGGLRIGGLEPGEEKRFAVGSTSSTPIWTNCSGVSEATSRRNEPPPRFGQGTSDFPQS